jgi:hypothetical protein
MICSSVNRFFFILSILNGPDSNRFWWNFSGAGHDLSNPRFPVTASRENGVAVWSGVNGLFITCHGGGK